jgi:hypothetical protein
MTIVLWFICHDGCQRGSSGAVWALGAQEDAVLPTSRVAAALHHTAVATAAERNGIAAAGSTAALARARRCPAGSYLEKKGKWKKVRAGWVGEKQERVCGGAGRARLLIHEEEANAESEHGALRAVVDPLLTPGTCPSRRDEASIKPPSEMTDMRCNGFAIP